MGKATWVWTGTAALLALLANGAAAAQTAAAAQPGTTTVTYQGVQVAIDPKTGRLREPTAEERAALSRAMTQQQAQQAVRPLARGQRPRNASEAAATFRTSAVGRVGGIAQVPEDQMNALEVARTPDGRLDIHHVGDTDHAGTAQEVVK